MKDLKVCKYRPLGGSYYYKLDFLRKERFWHVSTENKDFDTLLRYNLIYKYLFTNHIFKIYLHSLQSIVYLLTVDEHLNHLGDFKDCAQSSPQKVITIFKASQVILMCSQGCNTLIYFLILWLLSYFYDSIFFQRFPVWSLPSLYS